MFMFYNTRHFRPIRWVGKGATLLSFRFFGFLGYSSETINILHLLSQQKLYYLWYIYLYIFQWWEKRLTESGIPPNPSLVCIVRLSYIRILLTLKVIYLVPLPDPFEAIVTPPSDSGQH